MKIYLSQLKKAPIKGIFLIQFRLPKSRLRFPAPFRRRRGSQGYSLILVVLLVLTILTTIVSLNVRILSGQYGLTLQGNLRMARNAAENGLIIASSELNKPGNRLLLGRLPVNQWATRWDERNGWPTRGNYYSLLSDQDFNNLNLDCKRYGRNKLQVTEQAVRMPSVNSIQLETGGVQSSRIISFRLFDQNRNLIQTNATVSSTQKSFLELTAQGYYNSSTPYQATSGNTWRVDTGSNNYASSGPKTTRFVLTQEFDLVPRCCGRSFPASTGFGTDSIQPQANLSCANNSIVEWFILGPRRSSALQVP